ncbi:hypothetical protein [Alistipes putredinis]|uniref:hypothetical protein n=1 Tax=Alistipes putredinis TaxID=28117 RepID=UPI00241F8E40|nr:hypothetical protein [Alistipes putredinis]
MQNASHGQPQYLGLWEPKEPTSDGGAYHKPFEKVDSILPNNDRNRNKTNAGENQCWDSTARKRLIEKTKKEDGSMEQTHVLEVKNITPQKMELYILYILKVKGRPKKCGFPLTSKLGPTLQDGLF